MVINFFIIMNLWGCYKWHQSKVPTLGLTGSLAYKKKKSIRISFLYLFLYKNIKPILQKMENVEEFSENGPQHKNPTNIYVDLNNPELLQIVIKLRDELQNVKRDNTEF